VTKKPKTERADAKVCINCHEPVRPIEGKVLLKGNAASWRHVAPPLGCALGDPLKDKQVEEA
jgi:hypothetical protein